MVTPFVRSFRRSAAAAAAIASLFGPAVAHAKCIDWDGNHVCIQVDDSTNVPEVHGKPVDTSTSTYHPEPTPPPDKREDTKGSKQEEPPPLPPSKVGEHKYVQH